MTRRDLPPIVPVTTLRVFEPLEAFPTHQRRALAVSASDPAAGRRAEEVERRAAWRRVLGRPDVEAPTAVRVLRVEGAVLLCPVSGEAPGASWFGTEESMPGRPPSGAPPGSAAGPRYEPPAGKPAGRQSGTPAGPSSPPPGASPRRGSTARGGTARPRQPDVEAGEEPAPSSGGARPGPAAKARVPAVPPRRHTLVRAWDLPVAWLAIVRAEDLTASGGAARYVLPMARARARAARALRTLRTHVGELDLTADAEGLARWLEAFHPRAWVEVDARPVAALVDGEDGADDVRLGLESLTAGEAAAVAAAYQRLRRRSRRLEDLSVSS